MSSVMARQSGKRQVSFSKSDICLEWTAEEQAILQRCLQKYASEPAITRYLNIANELPNKTTRDVACRARWVFEKLNNKRKQGHNLTSKGKNKTGIDYSGKGQSEYDEILSRALRVGGPCADLLRQSKNALSAIRTNIAHKIHPNTILFRTVEDNIKKIWNEAGMDPNEQKHLSDLYFSKKSL